MAGSAKQSMVRQSKYGLLRCARNDDDRSAHRRSFHSGTTVVPHAFIRINRMMDGDEIMGRYLLLWLLGIPLPILVLIYAFGGLNH
jgi:hypothetical protein